MAHNLYVGGFPYQTTKDELTKFFSSCGTVKNAKVILDRETGRPKGFGFVEMSTDAEAEAAIAKLNGAELGGRKIFVVAGRLQDKGPKKALPYEGKKPFPGWYPPAKPAYTGPERRSGKDRRGAATAGDGRREAPPPPAARPAPSSPPAFGGAPERKPWVKKPFDPSKKWPKKTFDGKKPFGDKKPFGAKKWEKPKNPHAKPDVPLKKTVPPLRGKKWFPKDK